MEILVLKQPWRVLIDKSSHVHWRRVREAESDAGAFYSSSEVYLWHRVLDESNDYRPHRL